MKVWPILLVMFATSAEAAESVMENATKLYVDGAYLEAADAAEQLDNVEGYALAARALLAIAAQESGTEQGLELLERALGVTETALEKNPYHVEALLQRVIALGHKARTLGNWPAHYEGLGYDTEKLIKRAIAVGTDEPWVWVVSGGWEAEILDGGGLFASLFYDVSEKSAIDAFDKAIAQAPDNLIFRIEYARALIRLGTNRHAASIREQLVTATTLKASDAFERFVLGQGRALLDAVETGSTETIRKALKASDAFRGS